MRNINIMSRLEYLLDNILWALVFSTLYRLVLFSPVFGLSHKASIIIFYGLVAIGIISGFMLTMKRRRNHVSLLTNQFFPLGIYCLLSFGSLIPRQVGIYVAIAVVLSLLYSGVLLFFYIRNRRFYNPPVPPAKCVEACLLGSRTLATVVLTVLIFSLGNTSLRGISFVELPAESVETSSKEEGPTAETCIDTVLLLQEEHWSELDISQRLGVMQTIANIEAHYMGIPQVQVITQPISETTLGKYNHRQKSIILDSSRLASPCAMWSATKPDMPTNTIRSTCTTS